ncbi:MAG: hypothetical protein P8186_07160 [Anaerolineae bacterium]|jgi:hypothetical protein
MNTLQAGIAAAREGRQAEARALLQQALQANPRSEQGWLWMSIVVESEAERRICLERVLTINPYNQTAQAGLEKLSSDHGPGEGSESYLPVSRTVQVEGGSSGEEPRPVVPAQVSAGPLAGSPSPHASPTLGMDPVRPSSRPVRRLPPQPEPVDGLAQLRAAQFQPPPSAADASSSESDPFMALVLIGGLSITAVAGTLMLVVLWIIGWPPQ